MNKAYGAAALLGFLGLSAAGSHVTLAQGGNWPIRVGQKRGHTCTRQNEQYPIYNIGVPHPALVEQCNIYLNPLGFEMWGVLDGAGFFYRRNKSYDMLEIKRNDTRIRYVDFSHRDYRGDLAEVNGHPVIDGKGSDFFETSRPSQSPRTAEERLVAILSDYRNRLNVATAAKQAEALWRGPTQQEIQEALDAFLK